MYLRSIGGLLGHDWPQVILHISITQPAGEALTPIMAQIIIPRMPLHALFYLIPKKACGYVGRI